MSDRRRARSWAVVGAALLAMVALAPESPAAPPKVPVTVIDRVVARFSDPESGQTSGAIRFVMMRELVLEAWLVAYERSAADVKPSGFDDKQLRVALERHVIEEVLSERLGEMVSPTAIAKRTDEARAALALLIGEGRIEEALVQASGGTLGGGIVELASILRRRARAELYLELAISQPIAVTEGELRAAYAKPPASLAGKSFDDAAAPLRIFLRASRLREASQAYYQAVRARLKLEIVT